VAIAWDVKELDMWAKMTLRETQLASHDSEFSRRTRRTGEYKSIEIGRSRLHKNEEITVSVQ